MRISIALLIVLMLSGCAFGRKTDYSGKSNFNIQPQKQKIIVAVHDMRPYVQNNHSPSNYTGTSRSLNGIPYNVTTKSGNPLADDFGQLIVNTMVFRNVSATQQVVPYSWTLDEFKKNVLGKHKGSNVYYIEMAEWKTESYMNTGLTYDLKLLVFDDQANEVKINQETGSFKFDKNLHGKENLATATSNILENLFDEKNFIDPEVSTPSDMTQSEKSSFKSLPAEAKIDIKRKCAKDYPEDFEKQAECVDKQSIGWLKLNK